MIINRDLIEWIIFGLNKRSSNIVSRSSLITGDMFSKHEWEIILMHIATYATRIPSSTLILKNIKIILTIETTVMSADEYDTYVGSWLTSWKWLQNH